MLSSSMFAPLAAHIDEGPGGILARALRYWMLVTTSQIRQLFGGDESGESN